MVTDSKAKLLESLTDDEKAMVRRVFLTQPLPEKADGATLLLPRSFVADGLMTQAEQDANVQSGGGKIRRWAALYQDPPAGHDGLRRPVPRCSHFGAHDAQRGAELLPPFHFARAVTVQSFVLRGFTAADEKILLTLEEARKLV